MSPDGWLFFQCVWYLKLLDADVITAKFLGYKFLKSVPLGLTRFVNYY